MILPDTSAWIEYVRRTGSPVNVRLRLAIDEEQVVTCDPVRLELLAGARPEHLAQLQHLTASLPLLDVDSADYDAAADLYRRCRQRGVTVRKVWDCLIAAVAIRTDVPLLHADRDFDAMARVSRLQVVSP